MSNKIRTIKEESHELYGSVVSFERWINEEIIRETNTIPNFIRNSLPDFQDLKISTKIDFSRLVTISGVALDSGSGFQPLENYSEGTRKQLWMSLIEWNQQTHDETTLERSVVRVYDEPDLNLDYAAEKRLFDTIAQSSKTRESRVQNILCTHSVTLVDKAPAETINLIKVSINDVRGIRFLRSSTSLDTEDSIKTFFNSIGNQLQIRNTEFFYEKGFLVFEGETEQELLPALYETLFGRSASEDGIILVNLHTCSNWRTTLEFLGSNRIERTVLILDKDCTFPNSSARISQDVLASIGIQDGIFFVGEKEIEDSFSDNTLAKAMQASFPREDGYDWMPIHIKNARAGIDENPKSSEDLKKFVLTSCQPKLRNEVRKVAIGRAIGMSCSKEDIPEEIFNALVSVRRRAGIT